MIAKALPFIITIILFTTAYFSWYYWRYLKWWKHALLMLFPAAFIAYTIMMALEQDYFPDDINGLFIYLDWLCLIVIPLFLYSLMDFIGRKVKRTKIGQCLGIIMLALSVGIYYYGKEEGFQKLEVRHVEIAFEDLPEAFDGYHIVQFSDVHIGTYTGRRQEILQRAIDSINAQDADLVIFTGDLQNKLPSEVKPHMQILSTIKAKDGIYSVMGNHDYSDYTNRSYAEEYENVELMLYLQEKLKWYTLQNGHTYIRHGQDSIVIAGMENDGEGRFPQRGNIHHALWGVTRDQFVVMLEHDPTAWRRKILPQCHAQLTLSGHTHAAQFSIFGWSPASYRYKEYEGLYRIGNRALYVSKGLGGVIPFRFGATGEIVNITLRKK